jgi:general secretion pathway protein I
MEVLTAMMILAISMVTILQLFSGGLRSAAVSGGYTRAIFHAREKMNSLLLFDAMRDMALEGEFGDGYAWRATIRHLNPDAEAEFPGNGVTRRATSTPWPLDLFDITVEVRWVDGLKERSYSIQTVHPAEKIEFEDGA